MSETTVYPAKIGGKPTVIDADIRQQITKATLEDRVELLEGQIKGLFEGHKNILEHFREMVAAVTEISEESSEEQNYLL